MPSINKPKNASSNASSNAGTTLALDVGRVRVGIAYAKSGYATPLETVVRSGGKAEKRILELIQSEQVKTLVVGLPLSEQGEETSECEFIRSFCKRLFRRAEVEILYVDEYDSSAESKRRLGKRATTKGTSEKSPEVDAVAASIILQSYLDGEQVVSTEG